ncbi:MAG: cell division protein FtsX [Paracoccaceae bacterium]|nr:cell division protein FtsX [Paracoccaceae bacterium]
MISFRTLLLGDGTANRVVPPSGFTAALTVVSSAAMAFLAVFAIALGLAASELATRWENELSGTATVRIPASGGEEMVQTEAVLTALRQTPGIAAVRVIEDHEQIALLAPWFGEGVPLDKLRLPTLIEVTETEIGPELDGLRLRLSAEAPGAVYDTHSRWRIPLVEAASRLRFLGVLSLCLIATVTAVTVALAAAASLAANGQVIDVLRLIGARDSWIAAAFTRRFTIRAFLGALGGVVLAMVTVAAIPGGVEAGVLSGLGFDGVEWLLPLLVPVLAAGLAFAATWVAARRRLSGVE